MGGILKRAQVGFQLLCWKLGGGGYYQGQGLTARNKDAAFSDKLA